MKPGRAKNFPGWTLPVLAPTWLRACWPGKFIYCSPNCQNFSCENWIEMIDSVTEVDSGRTTSNSCEVKRFRSICCQDLIVIWKSRSKLLQVSRNYIITENRVMKKQIGEVTLDFAGNKDGGLKQIMCSSLQSAESKKSETTREMSIFWMPVSEASVSRWEMRSDQPSKERCLIQKQRESSRIQMEGNLHAKEKQD